MTGIQWKSEMKKFADVNCRGVELSKQMKAASTIREKDEVGSDLSSNVKRSKTPY
jgi:hypothetical protein